MRIAIIIPGMELAGGIERVIATQANYWTEQDGHEVVLVTSTDENCRSAYQLSPKVSFKYIREGKRLNIPVIGKICSLPSLCRIYQRALETIAPDVVVTTMHGVENYFLSYVLDKKIPTIGVNHITLDLRRGQYAKSKIKRLHGKFAFRMQLHNWRKYDMLVALSATDTQNLRRWGCNTLYIPNPNHITDTLDKPMVERKKQLVMVGRLDYMKGADRLLEIWKEMAPLYPDWNLLLIGDGEDRNKLLQKETEDGLANRVFHIYHTSDVGKYLSESSIFVFTSRSESFGMVILEAFSFGLPVITYDCENGPRDLVKNYYNGFLIADGDKRAFCDKLRDLMQSANLREALSRNAIEGSKCFTLDAVMKQWNDLLQSVQQKNGTHEKSCHYRHRPCL